MNTVNLAIGFQGIECKFKAEALARKLSLPMDIHASSQLMVTEQGLWLTIAPFLPIQPNLNRTFWKSKKSLQQALVKACSPKPGLNILDCTAGWGKDAALLASLGASVCMLERNPIMACLLEDALIRAQEANDALPLSLISTNAIDYLIELKVYPDVIYLDPMHPARTKSALVKKNMQILHHLIGEDMDALQLLQSACTKALQKVVVKWPQKHPSLMQPDTSIGGKTVRFDSYYCKSHRKK